MIKMPFSGKEVVEIHKEAVKKCEGKSGWDRFAFIFLGLPVFFFHGVDQALKTEMPTESKATAGKPETSTPSE